MCVRIFVVLRFVVQIAVMTCTALVAQAQETPTNRAILVYDASGSMWGQIDGDHKVEIARDAVANMLKGWDTDTDLGLIAYGHRRKGDCSDIEQIVAPQPLNSTKFSDLVNALNPKGKTPLTDAVVMAAEQLGYSKQRATVILLTDGLETCERDPCEMARVLEERGIDFTAHVIAFDVAKEDEAALSCLATNTGGLYIQAAGMEELNVALQNVGEAAVQSETIYDIGPATITVPPFVVVGHPFLAQWTGPKNPGDWLHVRNASGTSFAGTPIGPANVGPEVEILAPPEIGTYEMFYEVSPDHPPLASVVLNVVTVAPSVTLPASVPAGSQVSVKWTGPGSNGDRLLLINPTTGETLSARSANDVNDGVTIMTAPEAVGTFEVHLVANNKRDVLATASFTTVPVSGSITMPAGPFIVGARGMQVEWSGPRNQGDRLETLRRGETRRIAQRPAFGTARSPTSIRIPGEPGPYTLRLIGTEGTIYAEQDFDVLPAE